MAKILATVGSVLRQAGRAVDSFGASMQGKYAYKETRAHLLKHGSLFFWANLNPLAATCWPPLTVPSERV